jgi:membrane-associated phospholipid phosphatase
MGLKDWARKNWRLWYVLYIFVYFPWFFTVERLITVDNPRMHVMHTFLDDMIPFCEYFIIPYCMWFLYIAISCVYMFFRSTDEEYKRFATSLIVGMSLCMVICMVFPSCVLMRPDSTSGQGLCAWLVEWLWSTDSSANVFPSIHVYNSLAIHIALSKSQGLADNKPVKCLSLVLCIAICLSTVVLKQHSVLDVMGACLLMAVIYRFLYIPEEQRGFLFRKA